MSPDNIFAFPMNLFASAEEGEGARDFDSPGREGNETRGGTEDVGVDLVADFAGKD